MVFFKYFSPKSPVRSYLDFASSTPIDLAMIKTFPALQSDIVSANPSALHKEGVKAKQVLTLARTLVANTLEAHPDEIIFTSNATESDNLALVGSVEACIKNGTEASEILVVYSALEHAAVIESVESMCARGVRVQILEANEGVVNPKDILVPKDVRVIIISIMYVNNEIGTVQPIKEIAKRVRFLRKHNPTVEIIFHCDATQAPLHYALTIPKLGIDMMTLGATKLYCPKGVGMLYIRRGLAVMPLMHGGGQERGLRPGTEPVGLIHTFAHALSFAQLHRETYTEKIQILQQYFEEKLSTIPEVQITLSESVRTSHITHIGVMDFDSELLVLELDARGIAVSAKSACKNDSDNESELMVKLYGDNYGAVRFSFGRTTTKKDLDHAIDALISIFNKYRK